MAKDCKFRNFLSNINKLITNIIETKDSSSNFEQKEVFKEVEVNLIKIAKERKEDSN